MSKKVITPKTEKVYADDVKRKLKNMERSERMDGWSNVVTLLGTKADKRTASQINWEGHDPEFFEQLYSGGGIAARIVDLVPEHSLRKWVDWEDIEEEEEEIIEERCHELDLRNVFGKAWKWGRGYGGGLIYIVTDTVNPTLPLGPGERVLSLQDLTRRDVRVMTTDIEYDMGSINYGKPRIYYLNVQMGSQYKGYPVHWTRVVRFDGQLVPRITYIQNQYWHDSILNRQYNSIRNYETAMDSAAACLLDFNVDVFKMKNLANLIAGGNENIVKNRIETMSYAKSVLNAIMLDADNEEYENKSRSLEGVAELLRIQTDRLVADTDIPHTILLGESPDGSSATGNSTNQQWYNFIATEQKNYATPKLKRLLKIILGRPVKFKWNPLRELDLTEQADLHLKQAQADQIYLDKNVLDPVEIAKSRFGGKEYSVDTEVDWDSREDGAIVPGGDELPDDAGEEDPKASGPDDGGDEPSTNKKKPSQQKKDDVFHVAGDQPPEGQSSLKTPPAEPEAIGQTTSEEPDKDLEGFEEPGQQAEGAGDEGQGAARGESGTQYDLRNTQGETQGTVPKVKSFIGQVESLPFRDPKTDPLMKGPGTPNKVRTILPTRGNGVTAQSGYDFKEDPKLSDAALEGEGSGGVEGQSIEPTLRKDGKIKDNMIADSGVAATMKEFAKGKLKSSSGQKVTDPKQAAAIGYNDSRAATIIVRDGDKILMGQTRENGKWTLPGGVVEKNESHHQGAMRELAEETGLKANKLKFVGSRLVEPEKGKNVHVNMYEHHIKDGDKPTHKLDPDKEVKGWKWFDTTKGLPEDVLSNLKHANNVALDHLGLLK